MLEELRDIIAQKLQINSQAREGLIKSCQEADGPMQSTHDTTRQANGWLANALFSLDMRTERALEELSEAIDPTTMREGNLGRIFTHEDLGMKKETEEEINFFFSVPDGLGGHLLEVNGNIYFTLSINTPILKSAK